MKYGLNTLKAGSSGRTGLSGRRVWRRILAALAIVLMAAAVAGCAASQKRTTSRNVGRPPPEQAPVAYSNQNRTGPLITPDNDPFAIR
ncbi:hypothetical protein ACUSIJ_15090 [Pseudochelatococcus sp. B33]